MMKPSQLSPDFPDAFYRVSVKGLCIREGKALLVHDFTGRSDTDHRPEWELPGGGLDFGESFAEGLKREVKEEVGLAITNIGYVMSMVYVRPDGIPCLIISLFAEALSEDVRLAPALTEYVWVTLEEAKKVAEIVLEETSDPLAERRIIEALARIFPEFTWEYVDGLRQGEYTQVVILPAMTP